MLNSDLKAQTATTLEIGMRGRHTDVTWDVAFYHANVRDELQCLTNQSAPGSCTVRNADRTTHQGVEAGLGHALLKSAVADDDRLWLNATYTYNGFRRMNASIRATVEECTPVSGSCGETFEHCPGSVFLCHGASGS